MNLRLFGGSSPSFELFQKFLNACPNIKILNLGDCKPVFNELSRKIDQEKHTEILTLITDCLKELEELDVFNLNIIPGVYEKIAKLTSLRVLKLSCCSIWDQTLGLLASLPKLEILRIPVKTPGGYGTYYSGSVTDEGLKALRRYPALKEVDLANRQLSQQALNDLKIELPDLKFVES